jgi:hypothetical protein
LAYVIVEWAIAIFAMFCCFFGACMTGYVLVSVVIEKLEAE